ncbi:MAG TPA: ABC transporter permease, partial [Thermodesulfobacteriota bacterium]|nr:ABC transporter permease [Thermodesulfobacteriota bacterium]
DRLALSSRVSSESVLAQVWQRTKEHLYLVLVSLTAAILLAIPLGILAARRPRLGQVILSCTGIIQTIPSLALLVFMIPVLGIGAPPVIVALFLYSLLPIVRNTYTGLRSLPPEIIDSAQALGLPPGARLRLIELPLASREILAGIKTSAVINVGTATLGALIGAGGYGQPILTGIRLNDLGLILQGAVPAALLALLVQALFDGAEKILVPRGLRLKS